MEAPSRSDQGADDADHRTQKGKQEQVFNRHFPGRIALGPSGDG